MKGLKIDYLKLDKELKGYSEKGKMYSYEIYLNKKFNSLDEFKLLLSGVSQQRELLNDFVSKYNASTDKFEGISEDSVDCYFKGIL